MNWWKSLKGKSAVCEPLSRLTSFKIGGKAQYLAHPGDVDELRHILLAARRKKIRIHVLGAGSNLLIPDRGVKGVVICLDAAAFKKISFKGARVEAGAGAGLAGLVRLAGTHSLSGFECLAGIPGTVGGSLVMNAGSWGGTIADRVDTVTVMSFNGCVKTISKDSARFGYRSSSLSRYIVLGASFKLARGNAGTIGAAIRKNLALKKEQQDFSHPSAGCIFKNPPHASAGKLIDQCGLKGVRVGGAVVSSKHANFILNESNASAADVKLLMRLVKGTVRKRFGVILKPEVKIWE
ncbi:MAG TPA: UDP-N-acetylmuramate dehydrogenase [Candidatus Omnitrophota bacterium]|nr:UDP-N-acetylmuramate dehydrogenase [Candidatus Omnitrophota bacterium]HPT06878.1 UDP-N-acetylmuramate dehydrogenase [Candidatus Omnitrophota bacterium]